MWLGLHVQLLQLVIWVLVLLPHSNFGFRVAGGVVVEAPPLADWAQGIPIINVLAYYRHQGASFARVCLN
jgi:hypothetical protein